MNKFWARKSYHIHSFEVLKYWFSNRDICLEEGMIKEWCYDGHFLYFTCGLTAPDKIRPTKDGKVILCKLESHLYEPYDEIEWSNSPFAHIIP